jgi:nicotinamidase-related amidase
VSGFQDWVDNERSRNRTDRHADWLRGHGVDQVDVVGIATDYCVHATGVDLAGSPRADA